MRKKLLKNWGLKLASLILAFILWFLVVKIENPTKTVTFNNVPVKLVNTELLEQQNKVYEVLDSTDEVRVRISAPRSIAEQLRASDIVAEADISKLTSINTVEINYYVNYEVDEIEGDHDVVRLNVEDRSSKWVKLQARTLGEVAEGYIAAGASPDQTLIEVTGPESMVSQISYAGADIDVTGATNDLSANVEVQLYDADGNLVDSPSIKKNVKYIHMAVSVLATKAVPVELSVMGTPADGYLATGVVESTPASVQIAGTSSLLSGISKISIPEDRLDITGATGNVVETINIREYLPENVRLADGSFNGRLTATVYIEPEIKKTLELPVENIGMLNLPEGLEAEFAEDETVFSLDVSGLNAVISPLTENNVGAFIDIAAWMAEEGKETLHPGTYTLPVTFQLPEGTVQENEAEVKVIIKQKESV